MDPGFCRDHAAESRRFGSKWYIGATNASNSLQSYTLSLPWLTGKEVTVLFDNKDRSVGFKTAKIDKKGLLKIELENLGGCVIYSNE